MNKWMNKWIPAIFAAAMTVAVICGWLLGEITTFYAASHIAVNFLFAGAGYGFSFAHEGWQRASEGWQRTLDRHLRHDMKDATIN